MPTTHDIEVVLAEDLAPIVKRALEELDAELNPDDGLSTWETTGALAIAAERSGIPPRTIYRILTGGSAYIDLGTADRLLLLGFEIFIELALPEEAFVSKADAAAAAREQSQDFLPLWCQTNNYPLPKAGIERRRAMERIRRIATRAQAA